MQWVGATPLICVDEEVDDGDFTDTANSILLMTVIEKDLPVCLI